MYNFKAKGIVLENIISNKKIDENRLIKAKEIISKLQDDLPKYIENGSGPFLAAICDEFDNVILKAANSVEKDNCSHCHAEMNAIKKAQEKFKTYDLSSLNLKIYVTAEPCIMCLGGIMWSGIKEVYFGVNSKRVEEITGFDEGFKPNWLEEFKKRNILVYGNIELEKGEKRLQEYIQRGKLVYKPNR